MFSHREQQILRILGRRKMTVIQITNEFYGLTYPFERNNYIGAAIRRISRKCEHNKLPWTISGKRTFKGRTVWREKRKL